MQLFKRFIQIQFRQFRFQLVNLLTTLAYLRLVYESMTLYVYSAATRLHIHLPSSYLAKYGLCC